MSQLIETLNPVLRGWMHYFCLTQSRRPIEELDAWVRRHLRCIAWRQWKRSKTRESKLRAHGLEASAHGSPVSTGAALGGMPGPST
ncbi:hypothetical protein LP414_23770 [Polaromonas sp. P1(28)-13]|nr:hypothetical protein LP414_23770 [Polaromonas sp. P1(28)-13]